MVDTSERIFICGLTGSGKTTFAAKIYEQETTLCVFINTNFEHIPEKYSQVLVSNIPTFIDAVNEGYTKICYNPTMQKEISVEEVMAIQKILFSIGKSINEHRKTSKIIAHIFIDEIQNYSGKFKPNINIDAIWKRGRRFGVIGIAISQRPTDVSHTILTQSKYHVIFKTSIYETQYFQSYHIPVEQHQDWLKHKYHFIIFDGYTVERFKPIQI